MRYAATLALLIVTLATPANAAHRHRSHDPMVNLLAYGLAQMLSSEASLGYEPYRHRHHGYAHQRARHGHYGRSYNHGTLPGPCYLAARQGGPCGCLAMGKILGRYDHVLHGMNLWMANSWLGFPRTSPRPGTAAVWPGRHVEAVVAVNGDGTITTSGPYGNRRVRLGSVVIVDPHGSYTSHHYARQHYASRHWRHWRYARAW